MADGIEFKIEGLDRAIDRMSTLPSKLQKRGLRAALRKGANVFRDAARVNARAIDDPETADMISRNITTQTMSSRSAKRAGADLGMRVGVMGGAKPLKKGTATGLPGGNTTHWRMIELGTSKARAQPFMRNAMSENVDKATNTAADELINQLDKLGA